MDELEIIYNYFEENGDSDLHSLMRYLDTDTLVAWFVDEGYADNVDEDEQELLQEYYEAHCR